MVTLFSFAIFILLFIGVGLSSIKFKKKNVSDYYIASRGVSAPLVGLSAVTSLLSGFLFLGAVGAIYQHGLSIAWLFIISVIGHILVYYFYIGKFARVCKDKNFSTYTQFLSKFNGKFFYKYSIFASILIIFFLGLYASSQLLSGAKTLHSFYDIDLDIGALIVLVVVIVYCYAGGIRASIWTDAVQSLVMMLAMMCLVGSAIYEIGGFGVLFDKLNVIDGKYTSLIVGGSYPKTFNVILKWSFLLFAVSLGLPHIMVRYMTLADTGKVKQVGTCFISYLIVFYSLSVLSGLCARVLINPEELKDVEYAFFVLSERLLPDVVIGIVMAGIFASIISTTDSLVLMCSASITKDMFPKLGNKYSYAKISTVLIGVLIYLFYLFGSRSVFDLVIMSIGAIGSVFAPLVVLFMYNKKINEITQIMMGVCSLAVYIVWHYKYSYIVNEAVPAVITAFLVYFIGYRFSIIKNR